MDQLKNSHPRAARVTILQKITARATSCSKTLLLLSINHGFIQILFLLLFFFFRALYACTHANVVRVISNSSGSIVVLWRPGLYDARFNGLGCWFLFPSVRATSPLAKFSAIENGCTSRFDSQCTASLTSPVPLPYLLSLCIPIVYPSLHLTGRCLREVRSHSTVPNIFLNPPVRSPPTLVPSDVTVLSTDSAQKFEVTRPYSYIDFGSTKVHQVTQP